MCIRRTMSVLTRSCLVSITHLIKAYIFYMLLLPLPFIFLLKVMLQLPLPGHSAQDWTDVKRRARQGLLLCPFWLICYVVFCLLTSLLPFSSSSGFYALGWLAFFIRSLVYNVVYRSVYMYLCRIRLGIHADMFARTKYDYWRGPSEKCKYWM